MNVFPLYIAGFRVKLCAEYDFAVQQCAAYRGDFDPEEAELTVSASPEELRAEQAAAAEMGHSHGTGYLESVCLYRNLCRQLPSHGALLLHAAVITDGTHGYAFTAPSGTGKSTHIRLWRRAFGEQIRVINGDKPILRRVGGIWHAWGTPWCGKEGWQTNASVPLDGICFLCRGEENRIAPLPAAEAVSAVVHQVIIPPDPAEAAATLTLLDDLVRTVPLYRMSCTVSEEAAHIAREGMTRGRRL